VELLPTHFGEKIAIQGAVALSPERRYEVIEIYCQFGGSEYFRIDHSADEAPALFDTRIFHLVDESLPDFWTIFLYEDGSLKIGPKTWQIDGFWESFLDRQSWAIDAYEAGRRL
jgi:hypothetical protein